MTQYEYLISIILIATFICGLFLILLRAILRADVAVFDSDETMEGKVVIISGGNSGIGYESAKDLAKRGARVIIGCRNENRGRAARDKIAEDTGNPNIFYVNLDLASLGSIREFANYVKEKEPNIDVLINNAGTFGLGYKHSKDGIIEIMQVNFFGHFLLTLLLLPLLERSDSARIINVTSLMHYMGYINFRCINKEDSYCNSRGYSNSKLCLTTFTVCLARRLKRTNIAVNCVHPGALRTRISLNFGSILGFLFRYFSWICYRSVREGAQTILYLAVSKQTSTVTAKFLVDRHEYFLPRQANSVRTGNKLWDYSIKLLNIEIEEISKTVNETTTI